MHAETGIPVAEVLRRMGISEQTFYRWKKLGRMAQFPAVRGLQVCQIYVYMFLTKGIAMRGPGIDLKDSIIDHMATRSPFEVWLPADFADLGPRDAVDQVLHRLVRADTIRRITRGLYDKPSLNGSHWQINPP